MVWCFRWRDHICGHSHGCGYGTDGGLSFWVRKGPRACPGLVCLLSCVGHTQCHNLVKIIVIPLLWSFLSIVARSTFTFLCWSHKFGQQENKTGFKILSPNFNQEKKWLNATQFRVLVFRLWLAFQSIFSSTQSQLIQTLIFRL